MATIAYDPTKQALFTPAEHPTLFQRDVLYNDLQLAVESARLAYLRFEDDTKNQRTRLADALAAAGFTALKSFDGKATDTQAFGAVRPTDGKAILAFRGTEPTSLRDLLTDGAAIPASWHAGGTVHGGFAQALDTVKTEVLEWVEGTQSRQRLTICGHSLGGALATLAASLLRPARLVTIGSPRVGDATFARSLEGVLVQRIVNCCDLVTQVPLESRHFTHVGDPWYIDRHGHLVHAPDDATMQADRRRARLEFLPTGLQPGNVLARDLADHAPINYARAVF